MRRKSDIFESVEGFQWDEGNVQKNWIRHRVTYTEAEEAFFNEPLLIFEDGKHSQKEKRYYCLGRSNEGRRLFCVFTIRRNNIRIISIRDSNKKEKAIYEKAAKIDSKIS